MISYLEAVILGAVQGFTELFPISSLGHSVILPSLLGWPLDQHNNLFLTFLVATHLATAMVLLGFFYKDWVLIVKGVVRSIRERNIDPLDTYARLGWLIIVSTIPAGILGLLFEDNLKNLFANPKTAATFLILNGLLLFGAELFGKRSRNETTHDDERIAKISWTQSVKIGFAQCLALIPGFSRTGSTIVGGLTIGLDHADAARYSFLLATPIILAASLLKLPELFTTGDHGSIGPIVIGAVMAGVAAYLSVRYLTKYFKTRTLTPFAIYCVIAGIAALVILLNS